MERAIETPRNDVRPSGDETDLVTRPRANGDTAHTRTCLSCVKPFDSEGWHNRLCPQCRKRSGDIG